MSVSPALSRANALFDGVFAPLVLGGEVRPVRPLGILAADAVAEQGEAITRRGDALTSRVEIARVRAVRRLFPVDTLPHPSPDEWRLVAALSDLLQVANPHLPGLLAGDRPKRLLALVRRALARIPPPATLAHALARHASLARLLTLTRTDAQVSWWTGSELFKGESPPPRLLAWPERRRVQVRTTTVTLADLPSEDSLRGSFADAIGTLLAASPLTDLATADRDAPRFWWTPASLALLTSPHGTALARRALPPGTRGDVALERAVGSLPADVRPRVAAFLEERRQLVNLNP